MAVGSLSVLVTEAPGARATGRSAVTPRAARTMTLATMTRTTTEGVLAPTQAAGTTPPATMTSTTTGTTGTPGPVRKATRWFPRI